MASVKVALETGSKRIFAIALDWPGWARAGRTEEDALAALADYAQRYAEVAGEPKLADSSYEVVERLKGGSGTDFGVPSSSARADERQLKPAETRREARLLEAAWNAFDAAARGAEGRELRLGPRGGGRSLEKMKHHVLEAEEAYLHQLGTKRPKASDASLESRMKLVRTAALASLAAVARGDDPPDTNRVSKRWSPRYFVRRSAWHALDHAWEIEDRIIRE